MAEERRFTLSPMQVVESLLGADGLPADAHAGLVFDRYLRLWQGDPAQPRAVSPTNKVLQPLAAAFNGRAPSSAARVLLRQVQQRQERAVKHLGGAKMTARVSWRLVSGLGAAHPTESGFSFDATVGVPILPGSSVKGLARRAARAMGTDPDAVNRLFGPHVEGVDTEEAQGDLVFYDAYPDDWPVLRVDIVNSHHPDYYTKSGAFPRETDDPVPVYFLTVDTPTAFTFRVRSRSGKDAQAGLMLLRQGLELLGIGAKTAVGYGVMDPI